MDRRRHAGARRGHFLNGTSVIRAQPQGPSVPRFVGKIFYFICTPPVGWKLNRKFNKKWAGAQPRHLILGPRHLCFPKGPGPRHKGPGTPGPGPWRAPVHGENFSFAPPPSPPGREASRPGKSRGPGPGTSRFPL